MMRETSLDEHAAADVSEKSLTIGSINLSQARQATTLLQRDIGGVCSRNEVDEARTNDSQRRLSTEEEKKLEQEENPAVSTPPNSRLFEAGNQKPGRKMKKSPPNTPQPPQDYLRHVTNAATKRAGTSWWERVVVQRSSYVVEDLVEQYTADSQFLQSDPFPIAWLDRMELETGDLLGAGTYSNVSRIKALDLFPDFLTDHSQQDQLRRELRSKSKAITPAPESEDSTNSVQTQSTGYAIKHLKAELLQNSKLFEAAAADLIMEAKFLSRMSHPNILRLRGMALGGSSTFAATGLFDSYFLVVDELEETLIQRIHHWKIQGSTDQYQHNMILFKLKLAVQVASALSYLHERRLVFRDLKPHNIGLKSNGEIQLFDFGFCRELPAPSAALVRRGSRANNKGSGGGGESQLPPESPPSAEGEDDEDKLFCMSGKGTLLYMSAEVLSSRCYNQKADVYSWSMVTYELLTLQKPFAVGSIEQHKKAVCERGHRPPLHHLRWLSPGVKELLQHSWQANVQARWHMRDVKDTLDDIIKELESSGQGSFSKDSSFGYSASKSGSSVFCQGMDMDSIVMDITNTVQTRYEYITNAIFCRGATDDVSSTNAMAPDPSVKVPKPDAVAIEQKPSNEKKAAQETPAEEDKSKTESDNGSGKVVATALSSGGSERSGPRARKEDTFSTRGSAIWGSTMKKRMPASSQRKTSMMSSSIWGPTPTSRRMAPSSEKNLMASISMHSVRLSAAKSRQLTASTPTSQSMASHGTATTPSLTDSVRLSPARNRQFTAGRLSSHSLQIPEATSLSLTDSVRLSAAVTAGRMPSHSLNDLRSSMGSSGRSGSRRALGPTAEDSVCPELTSPNNVSCVLQTIRSEDEKSLDNVSLEEEQERKPAAAQSTPLGKEGVGDAGSESIYLPNSDTQYHSTKEESSLQASGNQEAVPDQMEQSDTNLESKKKKSGNPQDDQSALSGTLSSQFVPSVASV